MGPDTSGVDNSGKINDSFGSGHKVFRQICDHIGGIWINALVHLFSTTRVDGDGRSFWFGHGRRWTREAERYHLIQERFCVLRVVIHKCHIDLFLRDHISCRGGKRRQEDFGVVVLVVANKTPSRPLRKFSN